jgi:hypothetical protein
MSTTEIDKYMALRGKGRSEEQAIEEIKLFYRASNSEIYDSATKADLKISILELREWVNEKFNELHEKFHTIDKK